MCLIVHPLQLDGLKYSALKLIYLGYVVAKHNLAQEQLVDMETVNIKQLYKTAGDVQTIEQNCYSEWVKQLLKEDKRIQRYIL